MFCVTKMSDQIIWLFSWDLIEVKCQSSHGLHNFINHVHVVNLQLHKVLLQLAKVDIEATSNHTAYFSYNNSSHKFILVPCHLSWMCNFGIILAMEVTLPQKRMNIPGELWVSQANCLSKSTTFGKEKYENLAHSRAAHLSTKNIYHAPYKKPLRALISGKIINTESITGMFMRCNQNNNTKPQVMWCWRIQNNLPSTCQFS